LSDADVFWVRGLIEMKDLTPLRNEVRFGGAGQF
jgi:hypothetical protein